MEHLFKEVKMTVPHVKEHIELIAKHEADFLAQRTGTERTIDAVAAFVGSISFVGLHLVLFGTWIAWNTLPGHTHFDPAPFSLLGVLVALEAIILASFILIRQARQARRSEQRDHLILQILLLTEKETTTLIEVERQIAARLGLEHIAKDLKLTELGKETEIDKLAQDIEESLPAE